VDYGLSCNEDASDEITRTSETLDNHFLSLPERRVRGGNKRDPRSDLAGVCGLLYYCIAGVPPVDLVDAQGRQPHRRPGYSVKEHIGSDPRLPHVEAFLDRGFATQIDLRYQTIDELVGRLEEMLNPASRVPQKDLLEVAAASSHLLLTHDRASQLHFFSRNARSVADALKATFHEIYEVLRNARQPGIPGYDVVSRGSTNQLPEPPGTTRLPSNLGLCFCVELRPNYKQIGIFYDFFAQGSQFGVFRTMSKPSARDDVALEEESECVMWFDGTSKPDPHLVVQDLKASITQAMETIRDHVLDVASR
jgi:hypothetical protein